MVTEKCTITKNKVTMITDQNVKNRSLFCWANCLGRGGPQSLYLFIPLRRSFIPFPVLLWNRGGSLITEGVLGFRDSDQCAQQGSLWLIWLYGMTEATSWRGTAAQRYGVAGHQSDHFHSGGITIKKEGRGAAPHGYLGLWPGGNPI